MLPQIEPVPLALGAAEGGTESIFNPSSVSKVRT
jgi:hypothetical protein